MAGTFVFNLTLITNFLSMAISLWFAIYILARSQANPLTFRAVVALLAVAFYYNNSFLEMVDSNTETGVVRSLSIIIALIAAHDLTHYLLPFSKRKQLYWVARGIVLLGVISIVLLFSAPSADVCSPGFTCPSNLAYPWFVVDIFKSLFSVAIIYNLWLIKKGEGWLQNVPFYLALLLSASTIGYGVVGTLFNLALPRFIPNLIMLLALGLLLYSAAINKTFLSRRSAVFELPITLVTIVVSVGVYIFFASQLRLSETSTLLLAVLAILTHSTYDFVREFLNRVFRRQEHHLRQELRHLGLEISSDKGLQRFLQRSLAILCHNLHATSGLIALPQEKGYEVAASLHSLPVGSHFSRQDLQLDLFSNPFGLIKGHPYWMVMSGVDPERMVVVGVGARKNKIPFGEEDIAWLEDIAEEISTITKSPRLKESIPETLENTRPVDLGALAQEVETSELFSKLAYKLDPEMVKCVEEGFRNLNDYSQLGKSPLASMLSVEGRDHIERGKLVQKMLLDILENLRPAGSPPSEPLPREWYAYTILHDAYVEERLTREIMGKLYISEGTYFRLRRRALRGVARTLLEMGTLSLST